MLKLNANYCHRVGAGALQDGADPRSRRFSPPGPALSDVPVDELAYPRRRSAPERWNGIAAEVLFFLTYEPDLLHVYDPKSTERAFPTPSAGRWRPSSSPTVGVAFRCGHGAG